MLKFYFHPGPNPMKVALFLVHRLEEETNCILRKKCIPMKALRKSYRLFSFSFNKALMMMLI